ncbi:TPA: hypothetical protein ACG1DO_004143 [Kluyvera ascorbata]|uniref:hypothetical protein n=1 Tax=Kluyvera ascorbata TaxID=51288 RepID=UPI002899D0A4|nr:hypothetical protein [Kluyvera ascorbata]
MRGTLVTAGLRLFFLRTFAHFFLRIFLPSFAHFDMPARAVVAYSVLRTPVLQFDASFGVCALEFLLQLFPVRFRHINTQ